MISEASICNLALGHLGVATPIGSLAENSAEAAACNRFYEPARDAMLREFAWPFATKFAALGLVEEDPNEEWAYAYQYPSDCFMFRRILSGQRIDTKQSKVPYRLAYADTGRLIFTDKPEAQAEYTLRVTDASKFSMDFVMALSFRIAHLIAPAVTAGDPYRLGDRARQQYMAELSKAEALALNEEQPDEEPDSELGRARRV